MAEASIWIGFDPREAAAYAVCRNSIQRRLTQPFPIRAIILSKLQTWGVYTRPVEHDGQQLIDPISQAPMSTEFAISRFFIPLLTPPEGWALFMDCDIFARGSVARLFEKARSEYAVMCVKHNHAPDYATKMDGLQQTQYARKNWSSVMLFNLAHESNRKLTPNLLNSVPGRDLHRFCWLEDHEIGELGPEWNYLVGHTKNVRDPQLVHFTDGVPWLHRGFERVEYADEYRAELEEWAR